MAENARSILLVPNAAYTASAQTGAIVIPQRFTAAIIRLDSAAGTGTSPTLDVFVQRGIRDVGNGTTVGGFADGAYAWNDFAAFTQVTTGASEQWGEVVGGGNQIAAASDASLTSGTFLNGPIGGVWRVSYVIAGTNPSFTFDVVAMLIA